MITYGNAFCKGLIFVRVRNDEESKFMIEYAEDHEVVVNDDDSYFNVNKKDILFCMLYSG